MTPPLPALDPWPGVLDIGTITLLNGSPNAGKTALLTAILQRLSVGGTLFGYPVSPTPVFFIAMDRLWKKGAATWFDRYGFDIPHYSYVDDRNTVATWFRNPRDRSAWDAYITLVEQQGLSAGTLIATDPFENAWGNVMDRGQVITASTALQRYFDDKRYAQLGMMHSGKLKGDAGLNYANVHEQMAGSGTLSGYSSAQMTLLAPKQTHSKQSYELHITAHGLPQMIFGLGRDTEGRFLIDNYIPMTEEIRAVSTDLPPDQKMLLTLLPDDDQCVTTDWVISALADKYKRRKVEELLATLLTTGYLQHPGGKRGYWQRTPKAKGIN